jgi:hypothetical protein
MGRGEQVMVYAMAEGQWFAGAYGLRMLAGYGLQPPLSRPGPDAVLVM